MRLLLVCALALTPTLCRAQAPITDSVIKLATEDAITSSPIPDDPHPPGRHRHYDRRFWLGAGLIGTGIGLVTASLTSEQRSDLSHENAAARLGINFAPCRTPPAETRLAIADCEPNYGLFSLGAGLMGAGTFLVVQSTYAHPSVGFRVRF